MSRILVATGSIILCLLASLTQVQAQDDQPSKASELARRLQTAGETGDVNAVSRVVVDNVADRFEFAVNGGETSVHNRADTEKWLANSIYLFKTAAPNHKVVESLAFGEGNHVAVMLRHTGTAGGKPYHYSIFYLYTLNDKGQIVRLEEFDDPAQMKPLEDAMAPLRSQVPYPSEGRHKVKS